MQLHARREGGLSLLGRQADPGQAEHRDGDPGRAGRARLRQPEDEDERDAGREGGEQVRRAARLRGRDHRRQADEPGQPHRMRAVEHAEQLAQADDAERGDGEGEDPAALHDDQDDDEESGDGDEQALDQIGPRAPAAALGPAGRPLGLATAHLPVGAAHGTAAARPGGRHGQRPPKRRARSPYSPRAAAKEAMDSSSSRRFT